MSFNHSIIALQNNSKHKIKTMNKTFKQSLLLAVLFNIGLLLSAQSTTKQVPLDPRYRSGKLANGLTYYIMHNEEPKNRASFYMVQNVGAILENDDQNGLAHFLEHMAFNGTENFKGKGIIEYLEGYGVAFGRDINAYTGVDETVYNLSNVPTQKESVIDSCLLVLHDWSHYLLLTDEEIDAERGVISEEWRTRRNAQWRMREKEHQVLWAGSKYAKRDVIGDLHLIQNFKYQKLRDYYHKWYRTDLQAVVIIGDLDVDKVEAKVKELFSKIPAKENPVERKYFDLPDNKGALFVLATDKEATGSYFNIRFKYDIVQDKDKNIDYLRNLYVQNLFSSMMNNRISERLQKADPPFIFAQVYFTDIVRTKNAAGVYIGFKENEWQKALSEATKIVASAGKFGFTEGELKRAKMQLISNVQNQYNKRDKRGNDSYAMEVKDNFLSNEPVPGIEYELNFVKKEIPGVTLSEVNALSKRFFTDDNALITVSGPEKENVNYPTKDEVLETINTVISTKLEPYKDTFEDKALIANMPKPGKVTSTKNIAELGAKELVLSNGLKVYIKQSDLEKDKILFTARSWGGISKLDNPAIPDAYMFNSFIGTYGVGDFSAIELKKLLTGKIVSVSPSIDELSESISGKSSNADMETMFQLVNLYFTSPRFDEQAFNALKMRYMAFVQNLKNDVNSAFRDSVSVTMADHNPRVRPFGEDIIKEVSFKGINDIYKSRFNNIGDFTIIISGNFDEALLKTYLEKYIASIPATVSNENYEDRGVRPPSSDVDNYFKRKMATPKSTVFVGYNKKAKYTEQNSVYMSIIGKLLSKRYLDEIREKEGGTYGVSVRGSLKKRPYQAAELKLKFDCETGKEQKLKGMAIAEIDKLLKGEINETELDEVKKNLLKERAQNVENLAFWHSNLRYYATNGTFLMNDKEYKAFVESINAEGVVKKAKEFLKKAVKIEVVMTAKEK
jgi:zinc protease